ncbi:hypothetical protein BH09BAC1_BH09BAC1_28100 [soil metagenome]
MKTTAILALSILVIITLTTSCVKIQNMVIMKGDWELVNYKLDTSSTNFMLSVLPSYENPPGCCKYKIDFQDNDKVVGTYFVNDTVNYRVEGTWSLDEKSKLYINLDKYVNGIFDVDRQNRKTYQLTTQVNTIEYLPGYLLQVPTTLDIKRRN